MDKSLGNKIELIQRQLASEHVLGSVGLEALLEAIDSHAIVAMTDRKGIIVYVNDQFCELSKYAREELIGETHRIINSGTHHKAFWRDLWKCISSGKTWKGQICNRAKDGSLYWVQTTICPVLDKEGKITHYIALRTDTTETVQQREELARLADEAKQASKAKSRFLANMSHEIRTPMNGIIGMTSLLLDTQDLTADQRECAEVIRSSGEALLALVNDILDFSKVEAGKLELEIVDFRLRELLDDLTSIISFRAKEKGLAFFCRADPNVPDGLRGDPGRLRQILLNLGGNAVKFTDRGKIELGVSLCQKKDGKIVLRFSIRDTGIGISIESQSKLFKEFSQADSAGKRVYEGTGLGLAICKQLVELMNGEIGLKSEIGKGSDFSFTCPFSVVENEAERQTASGVLANQSVLLVENCDDTISILKEQFAAWGTECIDCSDGSTAIALLKERGTLGRPVQAVIVSDSAPDGSPLDLARSIRNEPMIGNPRIVLLSEIGERGDRTALVEAGFEGFISRPIRQSEVFNVMLDIDKISQGLRKSFRSLVPERFAGRAERILLVEDNVVNQMVAKGILEKFGLHTDVVGNGKEAIAALKSIAYDLVLMDVRMPELSGIETTILVRNGRTGSRNTEIPIVALTAHARTDDRDACLRAGMNGYVSKPIDPRDLYEAIDASLKDSDTLLLDSGIEQSSLQVFNERSLVERLMNDVELARSIVEKALHGIESRFDEIQSLLETSSDEQLVERLHSLKGMAGNCACEELCEFAKELEDELREGDTEFVKSRIGRLEETVSECSISLRKFLEKKED